MQRGTRSNRYALGRTSAVSLPATLGFALLVVFNPSIEAAKVQSQEPLNLEGGLINQADEPDIRNNISAIAIKGQILVVGADEGADVLVFKRSGAFDYGETAHLCIPLDGANCGDERKGEEIDIEGLAWGKKYLYVIGSHSRARKSVKEDKSRKENRERLEALKIEPTREQLFRLELDERGALVEGSEIKRISLRNLFFNHRILSLFQNISSKENGIDIEGLAVKEVDGEDRLYVGFRGPVLRGNHALVLVLEFKGGKFKESKLKHELRYVNLGGRGVRGMTELNAGGFLLLGGPVGDSEIGAEQSRYQVFLWDGEEDDVLGVSRKPLCDVPVPKGGKAEGIELLNKDRSATEEYRFAVVYDSAPKGRATVLSCRP